MLFCRAVSYHCFCDVRNESLRSVHPSVMLSQLAGCVCNLLVDVLHNFLHVHSELVTRSPKHIAVSEAACCKASSFLSKTVKNAGTQFGWVEVQSFPMDYFVCLIVWVYRMWRGMVVVAWCKAGVVCRQGKCSGLGLHLE